MTTKATRATITLGDIKLDVFRSPDGSYASPGLLRLMDTDIYRYEDCWYWLNPDAPPALEEFTVWHWDVGAFLSLKGNKLSYLFLDPVDPEREVGEDNAEYRYVPVPRYVFAVIEFITRSRIISNEAILRLVRAHEQCYSGSSLNRLISQKVLLRDTAIHLPELSASASGDDGQKSHPSTLDKN